VDLLGPPVPECSNCHEPRDGGVFSHDRKVYLCPKCVAFHAEFMRITDEIERDRKTLSDDDGQAG
jgi:recombinational DNA repair protein (RecF pathway)